MIRHAVIFGIRGDEGLNSIQKAKELKALLLTLVGKVPEIKRMEVGINHPDAPDGNAELILICDFDTIEDCAMYQINPDHVVVAKEIGKVKISRACVDYQVD